MNDEDKTTQAILEMALYKKVLTSGNKEFVKRKNKTYSVTDKRYCSFILENKLYHLDTRTIWEFLFNKNVEFLQGNILTMFLVAMEDLGMEKGDHGDLALQGFGNSHIRRDDLTSFATHISDIFYKNPQVSGLFFEEFGKIHQKKG